MPGRKRKTPTSSFKGVRPRSYYNRPRADRYFDPYHSQQHKIRYGPKRPGLSFVDRYGEPNKRFKGRKLLVTGPKRWTPNNDMLRIARRPPGVGAPVMPPPAPGPNPGGPAAPPLIPQLAVPERGG